MFNNLVVGSFSFLKIHSNKCAVLIEELLYNFASRNVVFNKAIEEANILQKSTDEPFVESFFKAFEAVSNGEKLSSPDIFGNRTLSDEINFEKLRQSTELLKPEFVFTIINDSFSEKHLQPYVDKILDNLPVKFLLSGYQAFNQSVVASENCKILLGLDDVIKFMNDLKNKNN